MLNRLHKNIHAWYREHGRQTLPWRNTSNAYLIYLSEIMLQQTQVKTVLERFYYPFIERFPTLKEVAQASLEDVLKQWEGLGYYTRAKNLHKCAQLTNGELPNTIHALQALPGIGKNTAHAIASFAYNQKVPVMEANVKRIVCRYYAITKPKESLVWEKAHALLDRKNSFDYNQAMMDIGATVCTAKRPLCGSCPLQTECKARTLNPEAFPEKKSKKIPLKSAAILIPENYKKTGLPLQQRQEKFLHGLWGFVLTQTTPEDAIAIGTLTQTYSHFKQEVTLFLVNDTFEKELVPLSKIPSLPLSKIDHKILQFLSSDFLE